MKEAIEFVAMPSMPRLQFGSSRRPRPPFRQGCRYVLVVVAAWGLLFALWGSAALSSPSKAIASPKGPSTATKPAPISPASPVLPVSFDPEALPAPVRAMREAILEAARTGQIEALRVPLELNELRPSIGANPGEDPIAYWRTASEDGQGLTILARLVDLLSSGYVRKGQGKEALYIWPSFAEQPLDRLSQAQLVDLYRLHSPDEVRTMLAAGRYTGYRLSIGADGVWHFFEKN